MTAPHAADAPAPEQIVDGPAAWRRLGLAILVGTVANAGMWAIVTLMPGVEAEFAVDRADASLPYTATMAGFGLGSVAIGRAVDRLGISTAMIGAGALLAVAWVAAALLAGIVIVQLLLALCAPLFDWLSERTEPVAAGAESGA